MQLSDAEIAEKIRRYEGLPADEMAQIADRYLGRRRDEATLESFRPGDAIAMRLGAGGWDGGELVGLYRGRTTVSVFRVAIVRCDWDAACRSLISVDILDIVPGTLGRILPRVRPWVAQEPSS